MVVAQSRDGLLAGVRVLDLTIWRPGPYATQLLAGLGADVIKVEPPGGDPMRVYASLFEELHAGKRAIVCDLKTEAGRTRVLELARGADVVIEGFRPGVVDRFGAGYEQVRAVSPTIIYCSVSGMGQTGPLSHIPGHDLNYQAWAGVLAPDSGDPVVAAVPLADLAGGMAAALAICAALVRRARSGEGERIDVAMTDVLATWTGAHAPVAQGMDPSVRGVPGYGLYATADGGHLALGIVSEDHFWRSLCQVLDLGEHAALRFVDRTRRLDELQGQLRARIAQRSRDELLSLLLAADVPAAPMLDRAAMSSLDHLHERGAMVRGLDGTAGDADGGGEHGASPQHTGFPIRFVEHPAHVGGSAPALDDDITANISWHERGD